MSESEAFGLTGYGPQIKRVILDLQSQIGRRVSYADVGKLVARMIERPEGDFGASTVHDWANEVTEPDLSVFLALAKLSGRHPAWIIFGPSWQEQIGPPGPYDPFAGLRDRDEVIAELEAERARRVPKERNAYRKIRSADYKTKRKGKAG